MVLVLINPNKWLLFIMNNIRLLLLLTIATVTGMNCDHKLKPEPAPLNEKEQIRQAFTDPAGCAQCHPQHYAEWQISTHAYAFTDPIFFRLNEIGQARSNQELDQFCIKCHSPVAMLLGETEPGFDPAALSSFAKPGIQCDVCHRITTLRRGQGQIDFRLDNVRQGPISDPVENTFHSSEFDRRYEQSQICTSCHDVFSPTGVQVEFTAKEWDESPYSAMGLECQGCHMPAYRGKAATRGPERTVHRHFFVGVDIPLVEFPGREQTIEMVDTLLKNSVSMTVTAPTQVKVDTPFVVEVSILNDQAGHNVPTGTAFERQMWLEIILADVNSGETIYQSGTLDSGGDLRNTHSDAVQTGAASEDSTLTLFHSIIRKNGEEIPFFWEADLIENNTIPPFERRASAYTVPALPNATTLALRVRLRFRSFAPYILRAIEKAELIDQLVIFDMEEHAQQIEVN